MKSSGRLKKLSEALLYSLHFELYSRESITNNLMERMADMQAFEIGMNEAGQRLDKYLGKLMPSAPKSFLYKMLRKKNIVLNDRKAGGSEKTQVGDIVKLYLADDTIRQMREVHSLKEAADSQSENQDRMKVRKSGSQATTSFPLELLYQDEHIMLVNKPQGILSQKSAPSDVSMVELIIDYLTETGRLSAEQLKTFHPSVVNRLDRNTSGILCAGISLPGSQELSALFRARTMKKEYLCVVKGRLKKSMHLKGYLVKNHKTNQVQIYNEQPGDLETAYIETIFTPLCVGGHYTLICADLVTGRSHQIRAHLASIGYPIAGDAKYGDVQINRIIKKKYNISCQCLHAWRMTFPKLSGALSGLSERQITAPLPEAFHRLLEGEHLSWQHGLAED